MHGFEFTQLLMDLIVLFNQLLLDQRDVLLLKNIVDVGKAQVQVPHIADDIQPGSLTDIIIPVTGLRVDVRRLEQIHLVVQAQCCDGNPVCLCHFPDRKQGISIIFHLVSVSKTLL